MESDRNSAREHSKKLRQELVSYVPSSKEDTAIDSLFKAPYEKKQRDDVLDEFSSLYTQHNLVEPLYNFYTLYIIHDQSDILGECVEAYAENIDGFGYQLQYLGEDQTKKSEKEIADEQMLKDFFDHANEKESWVKIRKAMRKDLEILGNGAFEIVRNVAGKPGMVYHIPFKSIRCTKVHPDPVDVQVVMKRGGEHIKVRVRKYFRKWAQVKEGGSVLTWFKSYGDPRVMNALTGEFEKVVRKDSKTGSYINDAGDPVQIATEIKQYKIGGVGQAYGVPRWMGDVPDVIGRRSAQYINYDLMNSQGIPPLVIMVSGGSLTDESMLELKSVVRSMRGKEKWNKVALLESTPENTGLEDRGNAKIELKNLTEYRKDDLMFEKYLKNTEETIRHTYRLPRMYVGSSIAFTHSTSVVARITAEEQVFMPGRSDFDEGVNNEIINGEFGIYEWKYTSKGPKIVGSKELAAGVDTFSKIGAFTINHAIAMANEAFGLQMSTFSEKWADYPIPLVLELLKLGMLGEIDAITGKTTPPGNSELRVIRGNVAKMEKVSDKIMDSDIFSKEEKDLYKRLLTIQYAMTSKVTEEEEVGHV